MSNDIHLSKADVTELEEQYVLSALRSGWVTPLGPDCDAFEAKICERVGVKYGLALSSGTAALHLALLHLGVGPGSAVVMSSMTFAATANAVAYVGATPVFVDSQAGDANVDAHLMLEAVRTLQSEGTKVGAVIPVDLYGRCCDYDVLVPGLAELGVPLVEDAAEGLGASLNGKAAGSFGVAAALSFNGNKIMTTSGGGMLLSNDEDVISRARYLSTQARQPVPWYEHTDIGYNYRLSNILAALGRAQLSRLDSMIERRRMIRARYRKEFSNVPGLRFLDTDGDGYYDNHWLTGVILDPAHDGRDANEVLAQLSNRGIQARHMWKPMHLQPIFKDARMFGGEVSESLFATGMNLPSGSSLTDADVDRVVAEFLAVAGSR